jgi:hypothetical protein
MGESNPNDHTPRTASVVRLRPMVKCFRFMDVSLSCNDPRTGHRFARAAILEAGRIIEAPIIEAPFDVAEIFCGFRVR